MTEPQRPDRADKPLKEMLFESIVESATDFAIFSVNSEGVATSWNAGAQHLFGYSEADIIGRSADVIFTPEDRANGAAQMERKIARAEGRAEDERWHQRKDGSRFWASGLLMTMRGDSGFIKVTRDRTSQHRAETQIRESEELFRLLATNIPQMVFRCKPGGHRTWGSPQWVAFTGLNLENSVGFGWLDAVHPDDRAATDAAWDEARSTGEYYVEHRVLRAADQTYRWQQTRARPISTQPGSGEWVGTTTDIHDLRRLQDTQQVLVAELQHRTRNLLALVHSIANQTLRRSETLDVFRTTFESRLQALSRVQAILSRVDYKDIDLRELLNAELAAHEEADSAKLSMNGPPVLLHASAAQTVGLALHELTTNAVKYGTFAQPSGKLEVSWRIESEGPRRWVALEWKESGVDMPPADAPRRRGYGSELIQRALAYQLQAKTNLEFGPDGIRCVISVPLPATPEAER